MPSAISDSCQSILIRMRFPARVEETVTELDIAIDHIVPVVSGEEVIGSIHVGIDRQLVQRQLDDILFDIIVILVAAVLVTLEVMLALLLVYGTGHIHRLNLLLDQQSNGDFAHVLNMRMRDTRRIYDRCRPCWR